MPSDFPPDYVRAVRRMSDTLKAAVARGRKPRFQLPPAEMLFAACVDDAAKYICVNDDARGLVPALMHASHGEGTCFMLQAALIDAGVEYDTKSLEEMGLAGKVEVIR